MGEVPNNNLIMVTNIAPQATRDQMNTLFSYVGRVDELKLYPSIRDASFSVDSRCCFVRFSDPAIVAITQHLNNTVFIDRAIIITPVLDNVIPDETVGLILAQSVQNEQQQSGGGGVVGVKGDNGEVISAATADQAGNVDAGELQDPRLEAAGLPPYPALSPDTPTHLVNEIRRTVVVVNVDSNIPAQQCMEFFSEAGEVKFFRYCTRENDTVKYALIEFSERTSVVPALLMNGRQLGSCAVQVTHAVEAIAKPQAKSNEAAQREIEEAMSKVKEAQSLVSAAVDPLMGMLGGSSARSSRTRSRSRSRSRRRSRSRGRSSYSSRRSRRSRSRDRKRRSKSRDRDKKDRKRSKSKERKRSRSRDRKRSKSKERKRSRSRDRKRSRSRDRRRSRSRDRRRSRSRSRDRRHRRSRSRDRDRKRRHSRSKSPSSSRSKKDKRDRDRDSKKESKEEKPPEPKSPPKDSVNTEAQDMDISNSP